MVRDDAIMMIGDLEIEDAVPDLNAFLDERWPTETRIRCVQVLGDLGVTNAVDDVVQVFNTSDGTLKIAATEAVGKLADSKAAQPLLNELQGTNVSLIAIWALGNIGSFSAIPELSKLLSSPDKYVRYNARQALKQIGNRE